MKRPGAGAGAGFAPRESFFGWKYLQLSPYWQNPLKRKKETTPIGLMK